MKPSSMVLGWVAAFFATVLFGVVLGSLPPAEAQTFQGIRVCSSNNTLSASAVSSSVQLSSCASTTIVWNTGTAEAFLALGNSTVTATTAGISLPAGTYLVLNAGQAAPYLAAITASGTSALRIIQGLTP
jgi:hypothetical protein